MDPHRGRRIDVRLYSLTRPSVKTITIPPDPACSYTSTYSATTGLPASLSYPVLTTPAYQLKVNYNVVNGYLQSIADASSGVKYWIANTMNPRGQVTEATLGNGVVLNRGFDAVTGWMSTSQAGLGGGTGLQNLAYCFYEVGNLKTRQELNQALTETFYYDPAYRLLNSTLNGTANLTMTYDPMGDITSRSDVNAGVTWAYDPVHKHQMKSAGTGFAFTYDGNGNMLTGRGGTMTWYSYNRPDKITNSSGTTEFFYGPDRQYYKQVEGGGSKTTLYIGGLLEKVSVTGGYTEYRHKIQTDGAMIEVDKTTGTNSNIYYVTQDHLGSSAVITNSTGVQQVSESFNAWGSRRGSNWQGSPSTADNTAIANTTSDGFTGHTMLDSVKMIHMNGRVYDRVIGRFISADPTTSDPGNTQTWNRYSYANNNPLSSVDPTGFTRVPNCGSDWCPGPNYHVGPWAYHFGSGGGGSNLEGLQGNDLGYSGGVGSEYDLQGLTDWFNAASSAAIVSNQNSGDSAAAASPDSGIDGGSSAQMMESAQSQNTLDTITVTGNKSAFSTDFFSPSFLSTAAGSQFWGQSNSSATQLAPVTVTARRSYVDNYVDFVSTYAINVGPYATALAGGLWPKSWAPATNFRPPLLGSKNALTSVPRAFGVAGADSVFVHTGAAGIGLMTVGIGFYDIGIELEGFIYALPDISEQPPSPPVFPY